MLFGFAWLLTLPFWGAISPTVFAATVGGEFQIDFWKPDDGVPANYVTGFAQGSDGFVWMISNEGLARFDGARFVDCEMSWPCSQYPFRGHVLCHTSQLMPTRQIDVIKGF